MEVGHLITVTSKLDKRAGSSIARGLSLLFGMLSSDSLSLWLISDIL